MQRAVETIEILLLILLVYTVISLFASLFADRRNTRDD